MARHRNPLARLRGDQLAASSPLSHAALSASAGTGKTHVLTARVLRLLLAGADPSTILCLTFTKAGAAEMAERIHERLAHWVRLKDADLRKELFALDEPTDDARLATARTLFARVLDAPGGGLRIQTIHAFAQTLLAGFPAEAELAPGFRPLEGREEQLLARQTLAEQLVRAEQAGDLGFIADLQTLSHRLGEAAAEAFLLRCARAPDAMEALGPRQGIEARLRRAFGLPAGDIDDAIAARCGDDGAFDLAALRRIAALNARWGTARGSERAAACERWLAATPAERAGLLEALHAVWATTGGELRSFVKGQAPIDESYAALATAAFESCARLLAMRRSAAYVAAVAAGLRAGQAFAAAYGQAKRAAGVVDFDDLIRSARTLLMTPGMGDWVRYKLDQATDHLLVDEAQDTNDRQWDIVRAIASEYFAGEGASQRRRTLFTVGDFKQAIFGFQGTDPRSFEIAVAWFKQQAIAIDQPFLDLSMDLSFRSSPPILALADQLIGELGFATLGLLNPPNPHQSHHAKRPGQVTLWQPLGVDSDSDEDAGEEGWISDSVRRYAGTLARQIAAWLDDPFWLASKQRLLRPEDILILVRRRSQLAALVVARLHAEGVPVAGVDRLLLSAPLAVQDLLAAARFALQPLDDLNLAALLVSPLFGWSQDELFDLAHGREGALWPALRRGAAGDARVASTVEELGGLLAMADYATPHHFFETILSGPLEGRRKLFARLGPEARDPIEELVASALQFEDGAAPSLQRFLDWFARGDVEIVRDPSTPRDAVRVMTVHGSKGLQAPVVILADACGDPDRKGGAGGAFAAMEIDRDTPPIPVIRPRKDELAEPLQGQIAAQDAREREEYWRLLYVALTRAEERLYVGGALGPADRGGPAEASWHSAVERALSGLGGQWADDPVWTRALRLGDDAPSATRARSERPVPPAALPAWARDPAPAETRPPRPLAPSALGDLDVADPPPSAAMRAAAERGRLLHQLFERLPGAAPDRRQELADAWLARSAGVEDPALRAELAADACAIIGDPRFADIFGSDALAEAPIAAVTPDGSVVAGTVDRLLVTADRIRLIDFKTGRAVPASPEEIAVPHLRQMAAYVAALEVIFPGRAIDAGLLFTAGPVLHALPRDRLVPFMPQAPTVLDPGH